jgi:hypothetical protein
VDTHETFVACHYLIKLARDHLRACRQTLKTHCDLLADTRETFAARRNLIKLEREKVLRECTEFTAGVIRESTGVWYYFCCERR